MSYAFSKHPCDIYLNKIQESCKRVTLTLEKHNQQSIPLFNPPPELALKTPKLSYYRDYAKKKIDKICGDFESALKFVIEHPELYTSHEVPQKLRELETLQEFEKNENQEESDTTPKNDPSLKSLKRTTSERPERKKRTHLVPSNKYKFMKEYYKNVIKPNYSPKPRKSIFGKKADQ